MINAHHTNERWYFYPLIGVILGIVFLFAQGLWKPHPSVAAQFTACARDGVTAPTTISCLQRLIPLLMKKHTTAELMDAAVESADSERIGLCHTIGHMLGEQTYKKYGDVKKALAQCTSSCAYACIHGAIGGEIAHDFGETYPDQDIAHASGEDIEKLGSKYCSKADPCHVVGHLLYIALKDLASSLSACDRLSPDRSREPTCQGGVFMQAIGGLHETLTYELEALPKPLLRDDDYLYPCDALPHRYQLQCFLYVSDNQNKLFMKKGITGTSQKVAIIRAACESDQLDKAGRSACFQSIGLNSGGDRIFKVSESNAPTFCEQFATADDQKSCVLGRAYWLRAFVANSKALDYCSAQSDRLRDFCYDFAFHFIDGNVVVGDDAPPCTIVSKKDVCVEERERYDSVKASLPNYTFGLYGK